MIYITKNGEIKVWCDNNLLNYQNTFNFGYQTSFYSKML